MQRKFLLISVVALLSLRCFLPTHVSAQAMRLYGMTEDGGVNSQGVLFEFNPVDSFYSKKVDFAGTSNGSNPFGSLMQAQDGNLYGMTYAGGTNSLGVLFQYNPTTNTYSKKLDFAGTSNGSNPRGSLMQASDGNLYGMAEVGGANDEGVLFQFNPSTFAYADKYDFGSTGVSGPVNGEYPYGSLMQASDGNLYGMTSAGGSNSHGVLFQFNPSSSAYAKEFDFDGTKNGASPFGDLIEATDGNLYGVTNQGGAAGEGVLFQFDPFASAFTKKHDFGISGVSGITGTTFGIYPNGSLVQAGDGNLYGMTYQGGVNNYGVLFQYNPVTSTYATKFDFDGGAKGGNPYGSLLLGSDGDLYGMTFMGGTNNFGILFQFDPSTSILTKKLDFTGLNGKSPLFSNLIEISSTTGINNFSVHSNISLVPNPANNQISIQTSPLSDEVVTITIMNVLGEVMQEEKLKWSNYINTNIRNLPAGIYFIRMETASESMVKKFVKE